MNERNVYLKGIRPTSMALLVGTFGALIGLAVAIVTLIDSTIFAANATDSFLAALLYGIGVGFFALLLVPAFYFAIGWVVGWLQGLIMNAVLRLSGGLDLGVAEDHSVSPTTARATRTQPTFGERVDRDR